MPFAIRGPQRLAVQMRRTPAGLFSPRGRVSIEQMERAEARRLQPYVVRSSFLRAFAELAGSLHPREAGRFEVTHVPTSIRERDRRITGRNRREQEPVLRRYERVCFEKEALQPLDKPGLPRAVLVDPADEGQLLRRHGIEFDERYLWD